MVISTSVTLTYRDTNFLRNFPTRNCNDRDLCFAIKVTTIVECIFFHLIGTSINLNYEGEMFFIWQTRNRLSKMNRYKDWWNGEIGSGDPIIIAIRTLYVFRMSFGLFLLPRGTFCYLLVSFSLFQEFVLFILTHFISIFWIHFRSSNYKIGIVIVAIPRVF